MKILFFILNCDSIILYLDIGIIIVIVKKIIDN